MLEMGYPYQYCIPHLEPSISDSMNQRSDAILKIIGLAFGYQLYSVFMSEMCQDYKFKRIYNHMFTYDSNFIRSGFKSFAKNPISYMKELYSLMYDQNMYISEFGGIDPVSIYIYRSLPKGMTDIADIKCMLRLITFYISESDSSSPALFNT